jgi:SAM-dependent methyltransferase
MAAAPLPFKPRRFRSAAPHYRAGRTPYPPLLLRRVVELVRLAPTDRLLDLGCGPGPLAIGFAPYVAEIVAIDPEPEMLLEAQEAAKGVAPNIRFVLGSSYDLGPDFGQFRAVTMGRSFHWMDRVDTLRRLDAIIVPGGAVVLTDDRRVETPDNAWHAEYREIFDRHAGDDETRSQRRGAEWLRHEVVLLSSPFCALERHAVILRHRFPAVQLVDRALSMSSASRDRIGDRADDLAGDVAAFAERIAGPDGMIADVVEASALLARRAG